MTQDTFTSAPHTNAASRSSETLDPVTSQLFQTSSVIATALEPPSQSLINTTAAVEFLQQVPRDTDEVSCRSFYRSHFSLFKWQARSSWQNASSKEGWNPRQNWPTNGDNIAIWMTKPVVRQSFIQVQDPQGDKQKKTKTPNFSFSRRRAAADLHQTLHKDRGCLYHFARLLIFFNRTSSFGAKGLRKFWEKMPHDRGFFCL